MISSSFPRHCPQGADLTLGRGEIHFWTTALDPPQNVVEKYRAFLSEDEVERADRFHFPRHRRRFTVGRGALRQLLGSYLHRDPRSLVFSYGSKGKPALVDDSAEIRFNLSHSAELALYGLTVGQELGVDVERLRPVPEALQIAERFFSHSEKVALAGVAEEQIPEAFFNCWTRKEAYVKATGDGLSMSLASFDVSLLPGEEARMVSAEGDARRAGRWSIFHLDPAAGYIGAAAIKGQEWRLRCRQWVA